MHKIRALDPHQGGDGAQETAYKKQRAGSGLSLGADAHSKDLGPTGLRLLVRCLEDSWEQELMPSEKK